MTVNNQPILTHLLLCGLLGFIGQSIRVIIGLKKMVEEASKNPNGSTPSAAKIAYDQLFDVKRLLLSLFIGFISGCLASLVDDSSSDTAFSKEAQLSIVAAGYAGTDFIEGLLKKILPSNK